MKDIIAKEYICIDEILHKKGLKKSDLAKRLGVKRQTLYAYLQGNITLEKIINIANALEVEIWELFRSSGEGVSGFIEYKGEIHRVQSKQDLQNLLNLIK